MQKFWAGLATVTVVGLLLIGWQASQNGRYYLHQPGPGVAYGVVIDTRTGTIWRFADLPIGERFEIPFDRNNSN